MRFENEAAAALFLSRVPSAKAVEGFDPAHVFVPSAQAAKRRQVQIRGAILDDALAGLYNRYFGEGSATSPSMVKEMLKENKGKGDIDMFINSPGGSSWEMAAIINSLREQEVDIYTRVDGVAASAASVIMLEGSTIEIAEYGSLMLHRAWSIAIGNGKELAEYARHLQAFDQKMFNAYAGRITDMDAKAVMAQIDDVGEWWLTSDEAVEVGLADSVYKVKNKDDDGKDDGEDTDGDEAEESAQAAILQKRTLASASFLQQCHSLVRQ